ncbi:MAG TPA: hypothetical protein VK167_04230 [Flavipsychrobacter sp.]|nr:hypothetical protein [Flavipsychrobacter sp.]
MARINNYQQFIESIADKNFRPYVKRFQELAGLRPVGLDALETYLIEITFDFGESLLEHNAIKNFKKSTNRYYYHPEETNPPVKAHYHVIPSKGNEEIYAINMDGTAHHRVNKGYQIPRKEADELRSLGVNINQDNIIEHIDFLEDYNKQLLMESLNQTLITIYLEIEQE